MYTISLARSIYGLLALALVLALPQTAAAQATVLDLQTTLTVGIAIPNFCTSETLSGSGVENFKLHLVGDAAGGAHVTLNLDSSGTLIGIGGSVSPTGISYVYTESDTFAFHLNPFIASAETARLSAKVMLRGPARGDNSIMKINFHITMDANGVVTSVVDNFTSNCKG